MDNRKFTGILPANGTSITTGKTNDEIAQKLAKQGIPLEAIGLLLQGKTVLARMTPTPVGLCPIVSTPSTQIFPPYLSFGEVVKHPIPRKHIDLMLEYFGTGDMDSVDQMLHDRTLVSDARINTRRWTTNQLDLLDEKMWEIYHERLFALETF